MTATSGHGHYEEVNKDTPHKKGEKFRLTLAINAPYNEFNAQLLIGLFKARSALFGDMRIDRFLYGAGPNTPTGPGPFRFIMECTALRDIRGA